MAVVIPSSHCQTLAAADLAGAPVPDRPASAPQGRCNREKPPCKYFHPPQHLKEQLLINGKNNLAFKNALMQQLAAGGLALHGTAPVRTAPRDRGAPGGRPPRLATPRPAGRPGT